MKRTLLIGINQYPGHALQGCLNDVNDVANYLVSAQGFAKTDIQLLTDAGATTNAIRNAIESLMQGVAAGDTLLLHYSGHGTLFPVKDAQGNVTAIHGAICPVDFDWSEAHVIFDAELRDLLDQAPDGLEFIFVSDSCHSGGLTRGRFEPRVYSPPKHVQTAIKKAIQRGIEPQVLTVHDKCGLISGCTAEQESADAYIDGRYNGALTYYLLQSLNAGEGKASLKSLVTDVCDRLSEDGYAQQPQLHGPDDITARGFLVH
jgi:metacaspase-1